MSEENILDIARRVRVWAEADTPGFLDLDFDVLALADAVERMAAALRHAADTLNGCECEEAYDTLRELGIPLEAGDE